MPISNYPNGFANGVTIRGVPLQQAFPGKVFWVNNSDVLPEGGVSGSDGNPGTYQRAFATIDYAIGRCASGRGDIIMVMPGHAESVVSATTIAADVAGVAIVGLGAGTARPTLTYTTANTATISISAANIAFKNIRFVANFLGVVSAITVAAAPSFALEDCEFTDTSAILNFKAKVTTTVSVNADNLHIENNHIRSIATTNSVAPIVVLGTMTGLTIKHNRVVNTVAHNNVSQLLSHAALVMTDLLVEGNIVHCVNTDTATGGVLISTTATTGSGLVISNRIRALDVAGAIVVTAAQIKYGMFDNLYTGETTQLSGFILPAIGTD